MAELLLLEKAKTLKVSFPSPFATFLTARMAPGSVDSTKVILLSLCAAEEVIPITKQRIADQLVVDGEWKRGRLRGEVVGRFGFFFGRFFGRFFTFFLEIFGFEAMRRGMLYTDWSHPFVSSRPKINDETLE